MKIFQFTTKFTHCEWATVTIWFEAIFHGRTHNASYDSATIKRDNEAKNGHLAVHLRAIRNREPLLITNAHRHIEGRLMMTLLWRLNWNIQYLRAKRTVPNTVRAFVTGVTDPKLMLLQNHCLVDKEQSHRLLITVMSIRSKSKIKHQ